MVAEQHRRFAAAGFGNVKQVAGLVLAPGNAHDLHRRTGTARGAYRFGAAVAAARHKMVGGVQNGIGGAVVMLQQQHLRTGVLLVKFQQRLRVGGAKAVNALILVPDHKQAFAVSCQQVQKLVLQLGGVLRLVYAKMTVLRLKIRQNAGRCPQNLQSKDHLVIVIHPVLRTQGGLVAVIQLRQVVNVGL